MSQTNKFVFTVLKIVSWVIFVGLCIEAGGLMVNFIFSLYKPELVQKLYNKLDLSEMYERSRWAFFSMYGFILIISVLKVVLFYIVIRLVSKINLTKPFNSYVSRQISLMSYYTFSIGILSYLARETAENLQHRGYVIDSLNQLWADSQAFILMAAVIYVIATIFSRGVLSQNYVIQSQNYVILSRNYGVLSHNYVILPRNFAILSRNYGVLYHNYAILPHNYISLSRNYVILSRNYGVLSQNYVILSRNYGVLSQNYVSLSRNYAVLSRNYAVLSRNYATLSQNYFIT
jgi:hypothetical protein